MADEADTDRSGHVRNGRLLFHHIKSFLLLFKAKKNRQMAAVSLVSNEHSRSGNDGSGRFLK